MNASFHKRLCRSATLAATILAIHIPANASASAKSQDAKATAGATAHSDRSGRIQLPKREPPAPEQEVPAAEEKDRETNIARLLAMAPSISPGLRQMTHGMAYGITVPPEEREIVCLAVLHLEDGKYELAQHREVAKMMGIPDAKVKAIAKERYGASQFTERERALLAFTRQVVKAVRVDDVTFDRVAAFYDDRQIVETVYVIGIYMMLARLSEVAELQLDGTDGASFWQHQKDKRDETDVSELTR